MVDRTHRRTHRRKRVVVEGLTGNQNRIHKMFVRTFLTGFHLKMLTQPSGVIHIILLLRSRFTSFAQHIKRRGTNSKNRVVPQILCRVQGKLSFTHPQHRRISPTEHRRVCICYRIRLRHYRAVNSEQGIILHRRFAVIRRSVFSSAGIG